MAARNNHILFACRISGRFCSRRKEQEGLRVAEDAKKKEKKKPNKFKHEWMLNPRYWSNCYVENHGFFCVLCKKHNMKNAQNKSQTFIESPSKRLKEDSLKMHIASTVHSSAIQTDLLQCSCLLRMSEKTLQASTQKPLQSWLRKI